jgi:hypothetical protein
MHFWESCKKILIPCFLGVLHFFMSAFAVSAIAGCMRESQEMGQLEIVHASPIFQDITRVAFMHPMSEGHPLIHFSTLESYSRNPSGDQFLWISFDPISKKTESQIVPGSPEARAYAYSKTLNRYVLGTSLDPRLFLYDPEHRTLEPLFKGPRSNAFVHSLAVKDDYAYTILSTPASPIRGYNGILKVHLQTGKYQIISYSDQMAQGWGGVQTIDPTGRIWFYRAYPMRMMWVDDKKGMRDRSFPGFDGWTVESWDVWDGESYLLLTNLRGEFTKRRVDLERMIDQGALPEPLLEQSRIFLESIRVDLYHSDPSTDSLYFNPKDFTFYKRRADHDHFSLIGRINLGRFEVTGFHQMPQEGPTRWIHPNYGELGILGLSPEGDLMVWRRGRKSYAVADFQSGALRFHEIEVSNLSPADITSLAVAKDGSLYGGGILTFSHLFKLNLQTKQTTLHKEAIPNAEGQVNSMFTGRDGKIYGAGYPDSVLFQFDPSASWNPGPTAINNPTHLGPMGHHRQMRARKGIQDLDGIVWYQSVTDYDFPIAHALGRADFSNRTLTVKTDLEDGFPEVEDLAVFDPQRLILLGKKEGKPGLYLLYQKGFQIEKEKDLSESGGVLVNLDPSDQVASRLFLAQGRKLYQVNPDLSLRLLHRSLREISAIVSGEGKDILLIGKAHIERINLESGAKDVWWNKGDKPGRYLFKHLSWTPAVFHEGFLYLADEEKMWRFQPPRS